MTDFDYYLNLLHYPLKLENIIDKFDYSPFCNNKCTEQEIIYHKSLLLYLICSGYLFENILLNEKADTKLTAKIIRICKTNEYRCIKIRNLEIFEPIGKLYNVSYFTGSCPRKFFQLEEKCLDHIYYVAKQILYNISKEIL